MPSILPTLKFIAQHPLSSRRPLRAYWRYARWQIESRLRDEVVFDWIASSKLVARNGMTGATGNIYCGLHEFVDMAFLLHLLRPGDLFVDVGANIGSFTVLASAVCGADTLAFEPDPGAMKALMRNVRCNHIEGKVRAVQAAVGARAGTIAFTKGYDTTNRVATVEEADTQTVDLTTLDIALADAGPALIKFDVEGYEGAAVKGAEATFAKDALLAVLLEAVDADIEALLQRNGFVRAAYEPFTRRLSRVDASDRKPASSNPLFVRGLAACQERLRTAQRRDVLGHVF